jgi:hypothetical protein
MSDVIYAKEFDLEIAIFLFVSGRVKIKGESIWRAIRSTPSYGPASKRRNFSPTPVNRRPTIAT